MLNYPNRIVLLLQVSCYCHQPQCWIQVSIPFWDRKKRVSNTFCLISMCTAPQPPAVEKNRDHNVFLIRNPGIRRRGKGASLGFINTCCASLNPRVCVWLSSAGTNNTSSLPRLGKETGLKSDPHSWALCGNKCVSNRQERWTGCF